jgi:hypothetical protein
MRGPFVKWVGNTKRAMTENPQSVTFYRNTPPFSRTCRIQHELGGGERLFEPKPLSRALEKGS